MKAIVYSLLTLSILISCKTKPQKNSDSDYPFIGCWMHSYEENPSYESPYFFRPCNFKEFPVSRFRQSFEFMENGDCRWLELADNDAHYFENGTWELNEENMTISVKDKKGNTRFDLKLVEIEKDLLKIDYERQ